MSNKLTKMAKELLEIESDLPFRFDYEADKRVSIDDFELHTFKQTWGSTALGFGGIGGQAITEANTYVFIPLVDNQKCLVYFGGRFAYKADYCEAFVEDMLKGQLEPVYRAGKYTFKKEDTNEQVTSEQPEISSVSKKIFSPDDVRKMTQAEVSNNYQDILNSMRTWM